MKKLILFTVIATSFIFTACDPYYDKEEEYCGLVIDKFSSETQGKYPSTSPHIVIDCVTKKRKVAVAVGWNEYVNVNVGDYKCYKMTQFEIDHQ